MTKALDFIEQDIGKVRGQGWRAALLAAVVLAFSVGLALAVRPDLEDLDAFYVAQSAVLGLVLFGVIAFYLPQTLPPRRRAWIWRAGVLASLALSLVHEGLHGFSENASLVRFWRDVGHCFSLGLFTGLISGTILTFGVFRFLPLPGRRWQLGIAAAAALAGLMMLNLECPSPVASHIVFGHWAQGLLVTVVIVQWQSALFRHKMRRLVGPAAASGAMDALED
jgi:hypothetical protein